MPKSSGGVVAEIKKGSLADQAGLMKGDVIVSIDGEKPQDFIDYKYLIAVEMLTIALRRPGKGNLKLHIEKEPDEDLGIRFSSDVFDRVRTCKCACDFCFVSQLPDGLRPSLYIKDDDYRLSFLHGNFITLSNLTEPDFRRIFTFHLSPLWISVHTTEPEVRKALMNCPTQPEILGQMKRLAEGGIEQHAQIVVCPGRNDGEVLDKTIQDLAELHPAVKSIGVVPVGIIRGSDWKTGILPVGRNLAQQLVSQIESWQKKFLKRLNTRLVWASDELYLTAGVDFPQAAEYEDFYQTGNGIGEARRFIDEIESSAFIDKLADKKPNSEAFAPRLLLGTGVAAGGLVCRMAEKLNELGFKTRVAVAANRLLGPYVTSASLVSGADWLEALSHSLTADLVILPKQALNTEDKFLDDMSEREFARRLEVPVCYASTPLQAVDAIVKFLDKSAIKQEDR